MTLIAVVSLFLGSSYNLPSSGSGSGVTSVAALGSAPAAAGASISGTVLTLQPEDATHPGALTTGAQTIAGVKTLSSAPVMSGASITSATIPTASVVNLSGTNSGDITLGTIGASPANQGASLSSQVLTLQPADATHGGVIATSGSQTLAPSLTLAGTTTFGLGSAIFPVSSILQFNGTNNVNFGWASVNSIIALRFTSNITHLTFDNVNNVSVFGAPILYKMGTITAATTQTLAAATACTDVCNIGTVANAADAVKLGPALTTGARVIHVFNQGANAASLFPDAAGSKICTPATIFGAASCGSAGASISVAVGEILECVQFDTTANWGCK